MKKKIYGSFLGIVALFVILSVGIYKVNAGNGGKELTIAFTHDLHSHIEEFETLQNGEHVTVGGMSRIATALENVRSQHDQVLVVDGGDYSMGTLYQTLYETDSAELSLLAKMGYDAVTLGNHEFDYGETGLANSLKVAASNSETSARPVMVVSNIDWEKSGERGAIIKEGFDAYGGSTYTVINKGNVKIAIFGIFGEDSADCVIDSPLVFEDAVESAKTVVKEIKEKENPDMIVCLSHSGTTTDSSKSEDEILAKNVPDIDVIVSGHTHTTLDEPITNKNTYIVGCGCYGMDLGEITLTQNTDGRWTVKDYQLQRINESVAEDEVIKDEVAKYTALIDEKYLNEYGLTKDQIIAYNSVNFEEADDVYTEHYELKLGNIISDAFANIGRKYAGLTDDVVVGIVPSGYIRDTFVKGNITVDDVFNSYSLGIGKDGTVGYPLVCAYLTGSELRLAAEVDASLSDMLVEARMFCSGLNFTFNDHRIILNKVTDISLVNQAGENVAIENNKLYPVITDIGTAESLGRITDMSYGLISVVPKDKDGNPLESVSDAIIYNGSREVKAWDSIRQYMESFEKNADGISQIPDKYAELDGRKINNTNWNLWDMIRKPNKYAAMIIGVIVVVMAAFAGIVVLIVKCVKKRKKNQ